MFDCASRFTHRAVVIDLRARRNSKAEERREANGGRDVRKKGKKLRLRGKGDLEGPGEASQSKSSFILASYKAEDVPSLVLKRSQSMERDRARRRAYRQRFGFDVGDLCREIPFRAFEAIDNLEPVHAAARLKAKAMDESVNRVARELKRQTLASIQAPTLSRPHTVNPDVATNTSQLLTGGKRATKNTKKISGTCTPSELSRQPTNTLNRKDRANDSSPFNGLFKDQPQREVPDDKMQTGPRKERRIQGEMRESTAQHRFVQLASLGDISMLDTLLHTRNIAISALSDSGNGALHAASLTGNVKVLEFLLSKGADPRVCNANGLIPIEVLNTGPAAVRSHKNYDDIDKCRALFRNTSIFEAARAGDANRVSWLIRSGAVESVNIANAYGMTPMHFACMANSRATVLKLLDLGGSLELRNTILQTPLHLCASYFATWVREELADRKRIEERERRQRRAPVVKRDDFSEL